MYPGNNPFGSFAEERLARDLIAVQKILEQLGIVISHFFEMGNAPALVDGVTMEAAADLVVHTAEGHGFECALGYVDQLRVVCGLITLEQEIHSAGVRKFRQLTETAVTFVEKMKRRFEDGIDDAGIEVTAGGAKDFRLCDCFFERYCGCVHFSAASFESLRYRGKDTFKTRAAHSVFGRKISSTEKRLTVGS